MEWEPRPVAPLHATKLLVALLRKLALHADHRLEAGVEVRDAQVEELRELGDELLVEHVEHLLRLVVLLLRLRVSQSRVSPVNNCRTGGVGQGVV